MYYWASNRFPNTRWFFIYFLNLWFCLYLTQVRSASLIFTLHISLFITIPLSTWYTLISPLITPSQFFFGLFIPDFSQHFYSPLFSTYKSFLFHSTCPYHCTISSIYTLSFLLLYPLNCILLPIYSLLILSYLTTPDHTQSL